MWIDIFVDIVIEDINLYLKENPLNGTIFKNKGVEFSKSSLFYIPKYQTLHKMKVLRNKAWG